MPRQAEKAPNRRSRSSAEPANAKRPAKAVSTVKRAAAQFVQGAGTQLLARSAGCQLPAFGGSPNWGTDGDWVGPRGATGPPGAAAIAVGARRATSTRASRVLDRAAMLDTRSRNPRARHAASADALIPAWKPARRSPGPVEASAAGRLLARGQRER